MLHEKNTAYLRSYKHKCTKNCAYRANPKTHAAYGRTPVFTCFFPSFCILFALHSFPFFDWSVKIKKKLKKPLNQTNTVFRVSVDIWVREGSCRHFHPKTLIEIAMVLSTNSGSFLSNSHVSATFSILLRFGESWNPTNCERFNADGSLMGRTNLDKSVW